MNAPKRADWPRGQQCRVEECDQKTEAGGYCHMHYRRLLRKGDLGPPERKRLLVGTGLDRKGYRVVRIDGCEYKEHRLVMERELGRKLRPGENVHHLDGNRSFNDPSNLELWVKTQPCGQRATDRVKAAIKLLREYPELAADEGVRLLTLESQESTDLLMADFDYSELIAGEARMNFKVE